MKNLNTDRDGKSVLAWDFELSFSYNFIKQRELEIKEGSEKND